MCRKWDIGNESFWKSESCWKIKGKLGSIFYSEQCCIGAVIETLPGTYKYNCGEDYF